MSTEAVSGSQVASILTNVLGRPVKCDVRDPAEFEALFKSGSLNVEHWYAKGAVDFCVQVADGRMGYIGTVRDEVPHILGRPATTFSQWADENRTLLLNLIETSSQTA